VTLAPERTKTNLETGSDEAEISQDAGHDMQLLNLVDGALRRAGCHALRSVQIYICESRVTLRGRVRSYYQKQLAQHVTLSIPGVWSVDNQLTVS
jgi:osmotically-inducible protein OsmY